MTFELIGEERVCAKCSEGPAFQVDFDRYLCRRHIGLSIIGLGTASVATILGGLWLDPMEPIQKGSKRMLNLARLVPLMSGKLELDSMPLDDIDPADFLADAQFDEHGELVGFGASEETIRLVDEEFQAEQAAETEAEEERSTAARGAFKQLGRALWDMQLHRVKRALKIEEPGDFEAQKILEYLDAEQYDYAGQYFRVYLLRLDNDPSRVAEELRPALLHWAESVAIPAVTTDDADTEELATLYLRHQNSIQDLLAAGIFWFRNPRDDLRAERRKAFEAACVSPILLRLGREFFDEWDDDPGPTIDFGF